MAFAESSAEVIAIRKVFNLSFREASSHLVKRRSVHLKRVLQRKINGYLSANSILSTLLSSPGHYLLIVIILHAVYHAWHDNAKLWNNACAILVIN